METLHTMCIPNTPIYTLTLIHRGRKSRMINYLLFDFFFFHFQKKYKPTPNRIYTPMNIYIGFTLSPKSHAIKRLVAVLNYFLPKKDQPIQMAYITIMAIITPIVIYFSSLSMVSLASPESAKCSIIL